MQSTLYCFGMCVALFTLAPPTTAFSRGASHTSCQEMIPRHIRAHPQDPPHSYVTLRSSASSYRPGQFITVTVRSSRDFMGFLLQARSVGGAVGGAVGGTGADVSGVGARGGVGVGGGSGSSRIGPVLVGGSWTFTPPGTHTLRCLSDGDTLTHSDKQLKRNLSFVWRAPDVAAGDVRFYITVVQSYFVYWAGIESEVVHDGSRTLWNGRKTTEKDAGTFAVQDDERTDLRADVESHKQTNETTSSRTRGYDSTTSSTTLGNEPWTNERNKATTSGIPHFTTYYSTATSEDPVDGTSVRRLSSSAEEATETLHATTLLANVTDPLPLLRFLASFVKTESKESQVKLQDSDFTTSATTLTNHSFHRANPPRNRTHNSRETTSRSWGTTPDSKVKSVLLQESSSPQYFLPTSKPLALPQTRRILLFSKSKTLSTLDSTPSPQTSSPSQTISTLIPEHPDPRLQPNKSQPEPSQSGPRQTSPPDPQLLTTDVLRTQHQPEPLSTQNPPPNILTQTPASDSLPESMSFSPKSWFQSKTGPPQTRPSLNHPQFTESFDPISATNQVKDVTTRDPQAKIKTATSIFAISSTTEPTFSGSTPSSWTLNLQSSRGSTLASTRPTLKSRPRTTPAFSVPPSPSAIPVPPQVHPLKPSPTHYVASSNSSWITPVPLSDPSPSSKPITASSTPSPTSTSLPPSPPPVPSSSLGSSYSTVPSVTPSYSGSSQSTSPHRGPSPAPLRSLYDSVLASSSLSPSQELTRGESLRIQKHIVPSDPERDVTAATRRTVVHQNPDPRPKLDREGRGEFKPNHPNVDKKQKHPSDPDKDVMTRDLQAKIKTSTSIFAISSNTEPTFSGSTPSSWTLNLQSSRGSTMASTLPTLKSRRRTTPAFSVPPSPSAIPVPPQVHPLKPSPTHSVASSNSSWITPVPLSDPPPSSKPITASSTPSPTSASLPPSPPLVPSLGSSYSTVSSVTPSYSGSSQSTSPHRGPSPAPLRSLYDSVLASSSHSPSQELTRGESLRIQNHVVPSGPERDVTAATRRTAVHQNPDPRPKLDREGRGELKPNHPNADTKQEHPSDPDKDGKYPDIVPRHSAWELGTLLGCSAGSGMVLVLGVRYMHRQACGKRTAVTLNDREREYERGERGLIHVQECGDLVRVRRIRDNSFVLLAEYDILASPGD